MIKDNTQNKVFISLKEDDEESLQIANQIKEYLKSWDFDCFIMKHEAYDRGNGTKTIINKALGNSKYFLQILRDSSRSTWMQFEWERAYTLFETENMYKPILLYKSKIDDIPIDCDYACIEDELDIQRVFKGLIKESIPKTVGNLNLPPCFGKRVVLNGFDEFVKYIKNFKDIHDLGVERIYPSSKDIVERLKKKFIQLGQRKEEVRMLGFTLKRFVIPDENPNKPIAVAFRDAITQGATAKLLVLNRDSKAAKERASIESEGKTISKSLLVTDSLKVEKEYSRDEYKNKVKIGYYETPYFGMVLFEDEAFVELYNLGSEIEGEKLKEGFCGQVPILVIRSNSFLYPVFESHFERVWNSHGNKRGRHT